MFNLKTIWILSVIFMCKSEVNNSTLQLLNIDNDDNGYKPDGTNFLALVSMVKYAGLSWSKQYSNSDQGIAEYLRNLTSQLEESISPVYSQSKKTCSILANSESEVKSKQIREVVDDNVQLCQIVSKNRCLSTNQLVLLLRAITDPKEQLDLPTAVSKLCPLLLFQSHDPHCQQEIMSDSADQFVSAENSDSEVAKESLAKVKSRTKPTPATVWGFGFLFVTIVSSCSLVGVALLPLLNKSIYQSTLVVFQGLAVGSLSSSALFHLIPQAFGLLGEDSEHKYLWKSLIIFGGIYVFFLSERLMKIIIQKRQKNKIRRGNPDIASLPFQASMLTEDMENRKPPVNNGNNVSTINHIDALESPNHDSEACVPPPLHSHSHGAATFVADGAKQTIATVAWMIIFGDGLHNFIDGLSMGAAFSDSILSGISISVAVICEEFPHELGDFAILLSAGMTIKQALLYNFLSALTCYLGLIIGIFLGNLEEGAPYIFAFAGGMFLYISLVDMVAELSDALEEASQRGTKQMLKVFLLQNIGILVGVATLYLMARYSERINFQSFNDLEDPITAKPIAFFKHEGKALLGAFGDA